MTEDFNSPRDTGVENSYETGREGSFQHSVSSGSENQILEFPEDPIAGDPTGCCVKYCDPASSHHRFVILIFICFLSFGTYFCYDNPGALQDNFVRDLNITTSEFAEFYAWYSWPNLVLCFVGGFLIDGVFGIRLATLVFCALIVFGQIVFAAGALLDQFYLMLVGRLIFGAGGESLSAAQTVYSVFWFKGKELNMVYGLQISFARIGATLNFNGMVPLYTWMSKYYHGHTCLGVVLLIATATCILSLSCAVILALLDRRAERASNRESSSTSAPGEKIKLSDVKDFPLTFWLLCGTCVLYYNAVFPFIALGQTFFEKQFGYSVESANAVNSIVYIVSAFVSPLFGILVDKTGNNLLYGTISIVGTIIAHALLSFTTSVNPYFPMLLMGFSFSLLSASMWTMAALTVGQHQIGTAFGMYEHVCKGEIVDVSGYFMMEMLMMGFLVVSLILVTILWFCDTEGRFNMSPSEREQLFENLKDKQEIDN